MDGSEWLCFWPGWDNFLLAFIRMACLQNNAFAQTTRENESEKLFSNWLSIRNCKVARLEQVYMNRGTFTLSSWQTIQKVFVQRFGAQHPKRRTVQWYFLEVQELQKRWIFCFARRLQFGNAVAPALRSVFYFNLHYRGSFAESIGIPIKTTYWLVATQSVFNDFVILQRFPRWKRGMFL